MHMVYLNNKTGNVYIVLDDDVTNVTNEQDGQRMYLYCPQNNPKKLYVRSEEEFHEKFQEIQLGI
jgi:hypothetical protein